MISYHICLPCSRIEGIDISMIEMISRKCNACDYLSICNINSLFQNSSSDLMTVSIDANQLDKFFSILIVSEKPQKTHHYTKMQYIPRTIS